jgi:hypothetical protein
MMEVFYFGQISFYFISFQTSWAVILSTYKIFFEASPIPHVLMGVCRNPSSQV